MAARPAHLSPAHEVDALLANELLGSAAGRVSPVQDPPGLHLCPACDKPFVVPGEVHEVIGNDRVKLDLDCTNCGWSELAVHSDQELTALDMQLDRSFADLLWTLEVVWTANEEAAIGRFRASLDAGLILPEDF
ncbi:MAG: hypothetical protein ACJ762_11110 [Solirubrobacteraceae bacterium]